MHATLPRILLINPVLVLLRVHLTVNLMCVIRVGFPKERRILRIECLLWFPFSLDGLIAFARLAV